MFKQCGPVKPPGSWFNNFNDNENNYRKCIRSLYIQSIIPADTLLWLPELFSCTSKMFLPFTTVKLKRLGMWHEKVTTRSQLLQMHLRAPHSKGQQAPLHCCNCVFNHTPKRALWFTRQKNRRKKMPVIHGLTSWWLIGSTWCPQRHQLKEGEAFINIHPRPPPPLIYIHAVIHIHHWIHRAD